MVSTSWILALAPMQGVLDPLAREQLTALGGIDYCVTEFLRVGGHPLSDTTLFRRWPEVATQSCTASGTPVHAQLLGSHPERMTAAAKRIAELGAGVIDLNFGCPVRKVNGHDGGAALLKSPQRLERLISVVRAAVPSTVQVSAKLRLGWDNPAEIVPLVQAVEAGGASFVTIHGRTRAQRFEDQSDWARIGEARSRVSIPVVANGDIRTPEDLCRCQELSGCDRFLIGRGVLERPELFRVLRGLDSDFWPWEQRLALVGRLIRERVARGEQSEIALGRLKGWCQSLARQEPMIARTYLALKTAPTLAAALALVDSATKG